MSDARHMADFWNERAREDALFFVDNRLDYGPDRDETWFWAEGPRVVDVMLERSDAPAIPADAVTLDIGCGVGRLTRALADRSAHVHAVDVSAEMLDRARKMLATHGNITFHHGDGTTLAALPDASIDVAISFVVFQHIPDPAVTLGYIRELGRVLRPGGWTVFQVSNDPSVHRPRDEHKPRLRDRIRGRVPRGTDDPAWLGSAVTLEELDRALADAGLRSEHRSGEGTQYLLERAVRV